MRVDEKLIKANVLNALRASGAFAEGVVVASEVALGSMRRRIDLLVAADRIIGIEIKGPLDSLARLPAQIAAYHRCFEQLIVVVHQAHQSAAVRCIPTDCDIWIVRDDGSLQTLRENRIRLLPERRAMMSVMGNKAKKKYCDQGVSPPASYSNLLDDYRSFLTKKFEQTSLEFMSAIGDRTISQNDLHKMSRFARSREFARERERSKLTARDRWSAAAARAFGGGSQSAHSSSAPPKVSP